MKDRYGRPLLGLRISVTNDCDLNCFYCHREGCSGEGCEMTPNEIGEIVQVGTEFGIEKVKLTGGEPLIRKDIVDIVSSVSSPSISDVSITTNGTNLVSMAGELKEAGLDRINISLDTLSSKTYSRITGKDKLDLVLKGIEAALDVGLWPVKLNTIVMKGINDGEIDNLIDYSLNMGTILQLIELEEVLPSNKKTYERYHMNLEPIEKKLQENASKVKTRWLMQARRKYYIDGGEVEVINPVHNTEFCAHCTRIRVTPDGFLKPCLMRDDNLVNALNPIRSGDKDALRKAYETVNEQRKPYYKDEDQSQGSIERFASMKGRK